MTLAQWFSREVEEGSIYKNLHCVVVYRGTFATEILKYLWTAHLCHLRIVLYIQGCKWLYFAICEWSTTITNIANYTSEFHSFLIIPTQFFSLDNFRNNVIGFSPFFFWHLPPPQPLSTLCTSLRSKLLNHSLRWGNRWCIQFLTC